MRGVQPVLSGTAHPLCAGCPGPSGPTAASPKRCQYCKAQIDADRYVFQIGRGSRVRHLFAVNERLRRAILMEFAQIDLEKQLAYNPYISQQCPACLPVYGWPTASTTAAGAGRIGKTSSCAPDPTTLLRRQPRPARPPARTGSQRPGSVAQTSELQPRPYLIGRL